ncbi:flagellar export protein FliJ [bacterium]|nr:flagellar export protein FliJ [bacterium]
MYSYILGGEEVRILKKFKFRLQVVLDMREKELEQRLMEAAKIIEALKKQQNELQEIINSQHRNSMQMENLYGLDTLDIQQLESHRDYGIKLTVDEKNKERIIENTKRLLEIKQKEVREAHKKVEILKTLKEKQEKAYYKEFLDAEVKEIDDITSARFNFR